MNFSKFVFYINAAFVYVKLLLFDTIDYYVKYLILSLPEYIFDHPIIKVRQLKQIDPNIDNEDSDDDSNLTIVDYDVFVSQLIFVFKTNEDPPLMTQRKMHGAQLRPFVDQNGRFFIGALERYYPNLDTIILNYIKLPSIDCTINESAFEKVTKVLDVPTRKDIRSGKNCRFGVIL